MNKTKEVWCYVYGLLDDDGLVTYCGRSYHPRFRGRSHSHEGNIKILDKFIDIEHTWVQNLKNKGQAQNNKELPLHGEEWDVGDIFPTYIPKEEKKIVGDIFDGPKLSVASYPFRAFYTVSHEDEVNAKFGIGVPKKKFKRYLLFLFQRIVREFTFYSRSI